MHMVKRKQIFKNLHTNWFLQNLRILQVLYGKNIIVLWIILIRKKIEIWDPFRTYYMQITLIYACENALVNLTQWQYYQNAYFLTFHGHTFESVHVDGIYWPKMEETLIFSKNVQKKKIFLFNIKKTFDSVHVDAISRAKSSKNVTFSPLLPWNF